MYANILLDITSQLKKVNITKAFVNSLRLKYWFLKALTKVIFLFIKFLVDY